MIPETQRLVTQAEEAIGALTNHPPEAMQAVANALGDATDRTVILVGKNAYGTMSEEDASQVAGMLGATLGVGVVLVPDHTRELMLTIADAVEPILDAYNLANAERRQVEAVRIRDMGYRLNMVHLRMVAQDAGENWYPKARGGITVAAVVTPQRLVGIGAAFCHPNDQFSKRMGANKAIRRALGAVDGNEYPGAVCVSESFLRNHTGLAVPNLLRTLLEWTLVDGTRSSGVPFATWAAPWSEDWHLRASKAEPLHGRPCKGSWTSWGGLDEFVYELVARALATVEAMPREFDADGTNTPGLEG